MHSLYQVCCVSHFPDVVLSDGFWMPWLLLSGQCTRLLKLMGPSINQAISRLTLNLLGSRFEAGMNQALLAAQGFCFILEISFGTS